MRNLEQEDEDSFKRQFGRYIKNGVQADAVSYHSCYIFIVCVGKVITSNQITDHANMWISVEVGPKYSIKS